MKKIFKISSAFLAMFIAVMMVSCSSGSKAENSAVQKVCDAFDQMAKEVNKCKSISDLSNVDFDSAIAKSGIEDIDESEADYTLTSKDKEALEESINNFIDAVVNKTADLAGVKTSLISDQFDAIKRGFSNAVNRSTTLGDFVNNIEHLGF